MGKSSRSQTRTTTTKKSKTIKKINKTSQTNKKQNEKIKTTQKHCSLTQSRKRRKKILKEKEKGGFLERELMWCLGKQKGFSNVKCTGPKAIFSTNESVFFAEGNGLVT